MIAFENASAAEVNPPADESSLEVTYINELYADEVTEEDLVSPKQARSPQTYATEEEVTYLSSYQEAGSSIREGMKNREASIQVSFLADEFSEEMLTRTANEALVHTGDPRAGDYLRWHFAGWQAKATASVEDSVYSINATYTYTYYTTLEQEQLVDAKLGEVLAELNAQGYSRYEKISAIYDFICNHTTYDYQNLDNEKYTLKYSAYAALLEGTAVCQGYASLLYRMALELGVDCRLIHGMGNSEAHGWNIVGINGRYYALDSTWDAGKETYDYFLKCSGDFGNHTPAEEYLTEEFAAAYPLALASYIYSEEDQIAGKMPEIVSAYSKDQTSVKVSWKALTQAQGYEVYRATTPDATDWELTKTITSDKVVAYTSGETGELQYRNTGMEVGQTYYYKVRAYVGSDTNRDAREYSEFSEVVYMPGAVQFDGPYSNATNRIRLLWKEISGATGYQIWRQETGGSWKVVKTLGDKNNSLTDTQGATIAYSNTGLASGQRYVYKMRAFAIVEEGKKVFGAYSDEYQVAVMPEACTLRVQKGAKPGLANLSWTTSAGAAGYQIWMAQGEGEPYKIVKSVTDPSVNSYDVRNLRAGGTYYFKIRSYAEVEGTKTFGGYSNIVSVIMD